MYSYELVPALEKILSKLYKKDKRMYEIIQNPQHYKPLKHELAGERRVHIMKSFVLKFEIDEINKVVRFIFFGHHDEAYKR